MRGCCCPIIPYQEIIGNYSQFQSPCWPLAIIPYQEIIGNYSDTNVGIIKGGIIPYQEIIGNYSRDLTVVFALELYHTKK